MQRSVRDRRPLRRLTTHPILNETENDDTDTLNVAQWDQTNQMYCLKRNSPAPLFSVPFKTGCLVSLALGYSPPIWLYHILYMAQGSGPGEEVPCNTKGISNQGPRNCSSQRRVCPWDQHVNFSSGWASPSY